MSDIYKVQLPISTNMDEPEGLAYRKGRRVMIHFPVTEEIKLKLNNQPKSFWHAHRNEAGELVLDEPAPWQEW